EKYRIMFCVNNENITFKAEKGHLFPIDVGNISGASIVENEMERAEHVSKTSPKNRREKANG
ncbi:hypothetical protein HAX54_006513, partial [Datura stramonium]|nr:hypothetical protein [Datura stramonium]